MHLTQTDYDVLIIGAGGGGGVAAGVLAEAGKSVLVLERGPALSRQEVSTDHLRNHRLNLYGLNTHTPRTGNERVFVDTAGKRHVLNPHEDGYHHNAFAVGGGTLVYGAQAWRFLPDDFRMASKYGVPEGSSLADWPITYDDLESYYEKVEWAVGVAGAAHGMSAPRRRDFPMPPLPDNPGRLKLRAAARHLGWDCGPVPVLINTTSYNGRPACMQCGMCVGFACPNDSKTGSQNTMLPRALATRNCTLMTGATVEKLIADERGQVIGASYFLETDSGPQRRTVHAKTIVLAAAAIESARLLLNSATSPEPSGIGNNSDQVGRHLQGHYYSGSHGLFDEEVIDGCGPGVSIGTLQFNHNNPGVIGGGMLANEFLKLPIIFYKQSLPPGTPRWGRGAKDAMRNNYRRTLHVQGPTQDIASPTARVTIDTSVRDRYGIPVARLSGTQHPETVRTANYMKNKASEWLTAAGAKQTWSWAPPTPFLAGGQHQVGTCRMGMDPATSVTDPMGRVHSQKSLYVVDGGVQVSSAGVNPVLTIMATAWRTAEHIARAE